MRVLSKIERVAAYRPVVPAVRHHHERYQGGGYPNGLQEGEIPLGARILAVADAFDAMTSERPYRPPFTAEAAVAELVRLGGVQFDPEVVDAFQRAWEAGRIFHPPDQS